MVGFFSKTNPVAKAWDGSYTFFSLSGIRQQQDGSITFNVSKGDDMIDDPVVDDDGEMETVFYDSFETGLIGYNSSIKMGKKEWTSYPNGQIVSNTEMIPAALDGKKILMLFIGKNQAICEAEIKKTGISVIPEQKYYLSFDVTSSCLLTSLTPVFKFWIRDDNLQIYTQTLTEFKDKWEHIEIPFSSTCNSIEYGFYGSIYSGGIFVDNIKLQTMKTTSILQPLVQEISILRQGHNTISITAPITTNIKIYSLGGQVVKDMKISKDETISINLASGIYVVKATGYSSRLIIK